MELVCPAGSLPALKVAIDSGANSVYVGLKNETNARNFAGLNFDAKSLEQGINYAHNYGKKVLLAFNTYPTVNNVELYQQTIDYIATCDVDALIMADLGLMAYVKEHYPHLDIHLSVQGSATHALAIQFYADKFGISRAILPRVLSVEQVKAIREQTNVEIEVFGFGSLCVMVEGRCALSSYVTGDSPNNRGVCSPAKAVRWINTPHGLESRLNQVLIDCYGASQNASYPTVCKGRYCVNGETYYTIEEPTALNTLSILPELKAIGVTAIKIEGRQRSPAYTAQTTRIWRAAIDLLQEKTYNVKDEWITTLSKLAEGGQQTLGAYSRKWK